MPTRSVRRWINGSGPTMKFAPLIRSASAPPMTAATVTLPLPKDKESPSRVARSGSDRDPARLRDQGADLVLHRSLQVAQHGPDVVVHAEQQDTLGGLSDGRPQHRDRGSDTGNIRHADRTVSGKPVSVTPDTSRLALPPIPATRRSEEPVMDPAMPKTATSSVAETPTTTRDIEVRPGCARNSRRLNARMRSTIIVVPDPPSHPSRRGRLSG